jgi:hypothetical protein
MAGVGSKKTVSGPESIVIAIRAAPRGNFEKEGHNMSYLNSNADDHLKAITKRLDGEIADDFWGFTAYGARIHYHHGCGGERCNGTYPQYTFENPLTSIMCYLRLLP